MNLFVYRMFQVRSHLDYNDKAVCRSHWNAYVRVNYQFALNTVRNCRTQDFIWIHDYHLLLVGLIIRSLEPNIEVGFFLHIPFQPPELFFYKFKQISDAIVRALLGYTKVRMADFFLYSLFDYKERFFLRLDFKRMSIWKCS